MDSPVPLSWIQYISMSKNTRKRSSRSQTTRRLRGQGDYSDEVKKITNLPRRVESKIDHIEKILSNKSNIGSNVGRMLGSLVGKGDLGSHVGNQISKIFGSGDYVIRSNSLMNSNGVSPPKFGSSGRGTRVTEREFLCDIYSGNLISGSTEFTSQIFKINPSDRSTFPWLSTIALQFDQWDLHGLVFYFKSTSSTFNGASQALGTVVMATDYNVMDPPYPSKQIMENSDYACSAKPSEDLVHGVECAIKERPTELLYTGSNTGTPLNLTTLGNFQVATVGCSAANIKLGELWVSYDLTFYKKQLVSPMVNAYALQLRATPTPSHPWFYGATIQFNNGFKIDIAPEADSSILYFPQELSYGRYLIIIQYEDYQVADSLELLGYHCNLVTATTANDVGEQFLAIRYFDVTGPNAFINFMGQPSGTKPPFLLLVSEVSQNVPTD